VIRSQGDGPVPSVQAFRGWLLILVVFQCLLLLREAALLISISLNYVRGIPIAQIEPFSALNLGRLMVHGAFVCVGIYVAVLMFERRMVFRRWYGFEMKFFIALPLVEWAWLAIVPWPGTMLGSSRTMIPLIVIHLIIGLCWLRYIETSERAKSTFVF